MPKGENTMTTIKNTLTEARTIKNNSASKVSIAKVGAENYASWKFSLQVNYEALYRYASARHNHAIDNSNAIDKTLVTNAYKSIQMLLDNIGEVNGHALVKNESMLNELASCVYKNKVTLVGEALTNKSIVNNLKREYEAISNGASEDYVRDLTTRYETAKAHQTELEKSANSCNTTIERVSFNAFTLAIEKTLATYITNQTMTSWEELEARDAAQKAESKAKAKARRQAKRQAEAQAKTNA